MSYICPICLYKLYSIHMPQRVLQYLQSGLAKMRDRGIANDISYWSRTFFWNMLLYIPTYNMYIWPFHPRLPWCCLRSSFMDWILQVPRILESVSSLSWIFACPAHCSGNSLSSLLAGIGIGLCLGLFLGFWVLLSLSRLGAGFGLVAPQPEGIRSSSASPSAQASFHPSTDHLSSGTKTTRRSRVAGYLVHE